MKKFVFVLLIGAFFAVQGFAQLTVSGEVKTGILQTSTEETVIPTGESKAAPPKVRTDAGSKDDAGGGAGRFRLNVDYFMPETSLGFKFRLNLQDWASPHNDMWAYFFGYGNFFEDQLTVSIGKLGASPWGTGGPDLWKELEQVGAKGGMRFEYKPSFVPGLNAGFVINSFDRDVDMYPDEDPITILDVLQESIVGISYTNDYFHIRGAYRFDSAVDQLRGTGSPRDGGQAVYRVEERVLNNYLPGFRIWGLGHYYGIGADEANKDEYSATNWFFIEYAPALFTAQLRAGLELIAKRTVFNLRPAFWFKLFDNFLVIGAQYLYAQDYGTDEKLGKVYPGSPYYYMEIEPKVQLNFASGAYAALVYNWRKEYVSPVVNVPGAGHIDYEGNVIIEPARTTQWINLRVGMYF
jgi:hypothetical protein